MTVWIPVSQELPPKDQSNLNTSIEVLVTRNFSHSGSDIYIANFSFAKNLWVDQLNLIVDNVVAWAYLPEPYTKDVFHQEISLKEQHAQLTLELYKNAAIRNRLFYEKIRGND